MKNIYPATTEEQSEINLTPMLDVVFIMLIFFVVTASFVREFGLDITLPAGGEVIPQELETIKVVIEYDDSFHVNGRVLAKGSLAPYIRRLHSEFPDANFVVFASPDAHVESTVAAADAGRQIGFSVIPITELVRRE